MPLRFNARGTNGTGRRRPAHSATIAFVAVLCVVLVCHDLFRTWQDRSEQIAASQREAANLALSSEQRTEDAFRFACATLADLVERVESDGTSPAQLVRLQRLMARQVASMPIFTAWTSPTKRGPSSRIRGRCSPARRIRPRLFPVSPHPFRSRPLCQSGASVADDGHL